MTLITNLNEEQQLLHNLVNTVQNQQRTMGMMKEVIESQNEALGELLMRVTTLEEKQNVHIR